MKKLLLFVFVGIFAVGMLMGCAPAAETADAPAEEPAAETAEAPAEEPAAETAEAPAEEPAADDELFIGLSVGYGTNLHWDVEIKGFEQACADNGVKVYTKYANMDLAQQITDIENMVEMGIDMLVVGPIDSEGIVPTVEAVMAKGIPVAAQDINITGAEGVVSYVASDNYEMGVMVADHIGEILGGKGKVAGMTWYGSSGMVERTAGFSDTMAEKYPDIEVVDLVDCNADRTKGMNATEDLLNADPEIQVMFGLNVDCALGAYAGVQNVNRDDVLVVATDVDPEIFAPIKDGTNLVATVAQDPYTMGYEGAMNAIKHLRGEAVEDVATASTLVTIDNVEEIEARDQDYLK